MHTALMFTLTPIIWIHWCLGCPKTLQIDFWQHNFFAQLCIQGGDRAHCYVGYPRLCRLDKFLEMTLISHTVTAGWSKYLKTIMEFLSFVQLSTPTCFCIDYVPGKYETSLLKEYLIKGNNRSYKYIIFQWQKHETDASI